MPYSSFKQRLENMYCRLKQACCPNKNKNSAKYIHNICLDITRRPIKTNLLGSAAKIKSYKYKSSPPEKQTDIEIVSWTAAVARYTKYLVAVGVIGSAISIGTLLVINRQLDDAEANQRAFLFVSDTTVLPTINDNGQRVLRIFPKLTNSGETPTKDAWISFFCGDSIDKFNYINTDNAVRDFIGPKQTKAMGNCDAVVPETFQLKSGRIAMISVGAKAIYFDVFDKSRRHVTEFCATFPIIQDYSKDKLVFSAGGTFVYCSQHNCADDECPAEDR